MADDVTEGSIVRGFEVAMSRFQEETAATTLARREMFLA